MTWRKYLSDKGFIYSEKNDDWRKGLGFGRSIKVARIFNRLFEVKKDKKIVFSHFIESFEEFKTIIDNTLNGN